MEFYPDFGSAFILAVDRKIIIGSGIKVVATITPNAETTVFHR